MQVISNVMIIPLSTSRLNLKTTDNKEQNYNNLNICIFYNFLGRSFGGI